MPMDCCTLQYQGAYFWVDMPPGEEDSSAPKTMQLQAKRGASSMDPGPYNSFGLVDFEHAL